MACLPDEVWTEALQAGVRAAVLDYRDLCSLSITSRTLNRLSSLACLWKPLFVRDFPPKFTSATVSARPQLDFKAEYKARFEKIKVAKVAAHKRRLFRLQSDGAVLERECKEFEHQVQAEKTKLSKILLELKSLDQARIAAVALNVWQPERVRSLQQQFVEQQSIDPKFQQFSLEMEAKVCKEEIKKWRRRIDQNRCAIEKVNKDVEFLTYNPMQDLREDPPQKRRKMEKQST